MKRQLMSEPSSNSNTSFYSLQPTLSVTRLYPNLK